eukprot:TRINITY_DN14968_c3_g1_i1.p1 TRINITY_DN14968_c3_g1~~TRINITY_DN14968_c3_g1_i1.p1  ORF type:complete len:541 (+),score=211.65 TRINITY_DN14968_c3_g1_i1:85-1623(+)
MVKLDVSLLRFLEAEDFRVLLAVEMASRNHDIAPAGLVERIAGLRAGGAKKRLRWLLKHNFVLHECQVYDGYRMNYQAYDYLALRTFSRRGSVAGVGTRVGVGKESDIYICQNDDGTNLILKLQRLGRTSFRTIKKNRDYKGKFRPLHGESWYYLSRLGATKEYAFMKALHAEGFPVPTPVDQNRHAIVMSHINGYQLNSIRELGHPQRVFKQAIDLIIRFAEYGLIHGDFNEFNLMVTEEEELIVLDFPQMVSTDHPHAEQLFNRDVECIHSFFKRKWKLEFDYRPQLNVDAERKQSLDRQVQASGYTCTQAQEEEGLLDPDFEGSDDDWDEEEEEEEEEDEPGAAPAADAADREEPLPPGCVRIPAEALLELGISEEAPEDDPGKPPEADSAPVLDADEGGAAAGPAGADAARGGYSGGRQRDDRTQATSMATKRVPKKSVRGNYTVSQSGVSEINDEHVRQRVKGIMQREDMRDLTKLCKRNTHKVRDKRHRDRDIVGLKEGLRRDGLY